MILFVIVDEYIRVESMQAEVGALHEAMAGLHGEMGAMQRELDGTRAAQDKLTKGKQRQAKASKGKQRQGRNTTRSIRRGSLAKMRRTSLCFMPPESQGTTQRSRDWKFSQGNRAIMWRELLSLGDKTTMGWWVTDASNHAWRMTLAMYTPCLLKQVVIQLLIQLLREHP